MLGNNQNIVFKYKPKALQAMKRKPNAKFQTPEQHGQAQKLGRSISIKHYIEAKSNVFLYSLISRAAAGQHGWRGRIRPPPGPPKGGPGNAGSRGDAGRVPESEICRVAGSRIRPGVRE